MGDGLHCLHSQISMQSNFELFLKNLATWLNDNKYFGFRLPSIILDNCPSHRAKIVMDYLKRYNWSIYFLPPYSPQLAQVEQTFNHIKSHYRHEVRGIVLKLNKTEALNRSFMIMKPTSAKICKWVYWNFFKLSYVFSPFLNIYEVI